MDDLMALDGSYLPSDGSYSSWTETITNLFQLLCRCGKSAATVGKFPTQISMSNWSPGQRTSNPNKRQAGPQKIKAIHQRGVSNLAIIPVKKSDYIP